MYHPEVETSDLLVGDEVSRYRILVVCANWVLSLRSFDVHSPRKGDIGSVLIIFGCLKHHMKRWIMCYTSLL